MVSTATTSSTLVETVSINYEDFNESFLTCGTCLCTYDGAERTPKLLPCSHTVCLQCLLRITAQNVMATFFRCPICRESINIPRGGVPALPPSFLVNQLLDLMASQRREVIPKCSVHIAQELLFCESCDAVFCSLCTSGGHSSVGVSNCEHTVIPFSIAIKRMSEILLYKANECISKLTEATNGVTTEAEKLDTSVSAALQKIDAVFDKISLAVAERKKQVIESMKSVTDEKRNVLLEQLRLIQAEKDKVSEECEGLQYQVEVRNISQRISSLAVKLDSVATLVEPRENAFIDCDLTDDPEFYKKLSSLLSDVGRVKTTTTFPSLSTLSIFEPCIMNLESTVVLTTVDYHGNVRSNGGDPITATLHKVDLSENVPCIVEDKQDGTYHINFRTTSAGRFELNVSVVERFVKGSPLFIDVEQHNNPLKVIGCRGTQKDEFLQPVSVDYDCNSEMIYVMDTGNCRIKVMDKNLDVLRHIEGEGLEDRSCTGIAIYSCPTSPDNLSPEISDSRQNSWLVTVNWRTQRITRMSLMGDFLDSFTFSGFQEPIDIAVDKTYGHILVADNGPGCVFVFDSEGKFLFQVGKKGNQKGCFNLISAVTVTHSGQIIVADSRIQLFSAKGDILQEIYPEGKGKGRYGGITTDKLGKIIASRTEKGRNVIQIFDAEKGSLLSTIDSQNSKLKRPSGVAVTDDNHLFVVDLGNDCVKKYRYW